MKIAYVSHTRFPTEKAHGHQIARVCEALCHLDHTVTLLSPDVHTGVRRDHTAYYHLSQTFTHQKIPTFDALHSPWIPGRFAFLCTMRSYRKSLQQHFVDHQYDLLYARSPHLLSTLLNVGMPVVLELHTLPRRKTVRFIMQCNACTLIVCLTKAMRDELVQWGVEKHRIIVEGDAVDLDRFAKLSSNSTAKHHFHLPEDRPVVGYVGSLVTMDRLEKGVNVLIRAIRDLKKTDHNPVLFVVGGPQIWLDRYRKLAIEIGLTDDDIVFHEPVASKLVPDAIAACDVCIYPSPKTKHSYFMRDTSPLKLFEYAAAGKPIICADLPPVRDVFTKEMVRFVHPGSVSSLAGAIREFLEDSSAYKKRATYAKKVMKDHSWEKRMARILRELKIEN